MTKKTFIICLLWLVLGAALFYSTLILVLSFNLFSWNPDFSELDLILVVVIFALMICSFILAKNTKAKIEIWFSFLVAFSLMVFSFFVLHDFMNETVSKGFFMRSTLSPYWFRILVFSIYMTAIISWLVYPYKYLKQILRHDKIKVLN